MTFGCIARGLFPWTLYNMKHYAVSFIYQLKWSLLANCCRKREVNCIKILRHCLVESMRFDVLVCHREKFLFLLCIFLRFGYVVCFTEQDQNHSHKYCGKKCWIYSAVGLSVAHGGATETILMEGGNLTAC